MNMRLYAQIFRDVELEITGKGYTVNTEAAQTQFNSSKQDHNFFGPVTKDLKNVYRKLDGTASNNGRGRE